MRDSSGVTTTLWSLLGTCALAVILTGLMIARALLVAQSPMSAQGAGQVLLVLHADGSLLAAACALLWLGSMLPQSGWMRLFRAGVAASVLLFICDVVMIRMLGTRLTWGHLSTFAPQPYVVFRFLREGFGLGWAIGLLVIIFGGLAACCLLPASRSRAARAVLLGGLALGLGLTLLPVDGDRMSRWFRDNLLVLNLPNPEKKRYSSGKAAELLAIYQRAASQRTISMAPDRRKVILLVIESWSSYQSRGFGGVHDWSPALDAVAAQHTSFTRFYAGGACTAEGLMYMLGDVQLWLPFSWWPAMDEMPVSWGPIESVPRAFKRAGYESAFLTTGPLAFAGMSTWLKKAGFDTIEGNESSYYEKWPKLNFDAAPDEALYRRTLEWIDGKRDDGRWFLTVDTITSHIPYLDPATGKPDIEASFRYADRWAGWFVHELEARGFFKNGIVLITGDHRAMVPAEPGEKEKFGVGFKARIPLIVIDPHRPAGERIDLPFKQSDLLPTFRHWLGESVTVGAFSASLFEPVAHVENLAFHRRGDDRGIVEVIAANGAGQVQVGGDDTAFVSQRGLSAQQRSNALALIAHERLGTDDRQRPAPTVKSQP